MTSSRKKETLITSELEELLTCGFLQTSSFLKDFHRGNKETEFGDTFFDRSSPERYADFILYDSGVADPQRIIAVGNRELVSCFRNASIWFGDGTFSVVPEMYF